MARKKSFASFIKSPVFILTIVGLVIFSLAACGFLYLVPKLLLDPTLETKAQSDFTFTADDFGLSARDFTALTSDGLTIAGSEITISKPKGVVVMIGGSDGPPRNAFFGHAKLFADNGYASVIYDPRARGESEGDKIGLGISEIKDVEAVVTYIRGKSAYVDVPIFLYGISMGATTAINAAAENQYVEGVIAVAPTLSIHDDLMATLSDELGVPGWIMSMESPFVDLYMNLSFGSGATDKTPSKTISNLGGRGILLIHSRDDAESDVQKTLKLYEKAGSDATLWIRESSQPLITEYFLNPSHDEEYSEKLISFLEKLVNADSSGTETGSSDSSASGSTSSTESTSSEIGNAGSTSSASESKSESTSSTSDSDVAVG